MWNEFTLQARLKYCAFKRIVGLMETIILIILALLVDVLEVPAPYWQTLLLVQFGRVIAEILNHFELTNYFHIRDRWIVFPLF